MIYGLDKTIRIPVNVKNGAVIFPDDFNLHTLHKDFQTEIILSEKDFTDKNLFHSLVREIEVEFLPKGTALLVNISTKERIGRFLEEQIIKPGRDTPQVNYGGFVQIVLDAPQRMKLRGTKQAQLLDCPIIIPALPKESAKSINHAYKIVSQNFESWRRSNTANVFHKVYWFDEKLNHWAKLDSRRVQVESKKV